MGKHWGRHCILLALSFAFAARAQAQADSERALRDEVEELKRQVSVMADEMQRMRTGAVVPETLAPDDGRYGMAPGASRIYQAARGFSLGGYAEALYSRDIADLGDAEEGRRAEADFTRAEVYLGYKFNDWIIYNQDIEIEHAFITAEEDEEAPGEISVELAYLDFLLRPELNVRAGLMYVPMGYINEVHEPPFYYGTNRPEVDQKIFGSTWRENGVGIFGALGESLQYRIYLMNGLNANGFAADGLHGGGQRGARARSNDLAGVARVDFEAAPGFQFGGSLYMGDSSQNDVGLPDVPTQIWEVHTQYERRGFHFRALYTQADVGNARELTRALGLIPDDGEVDRSVAKQLIGGYAEVAYDLMPWFRDGTEHKLAPFFRFEYLDPQARVASGFVRNGTVRRRLYIAGIQYWPHPNVVIKLDYRNIESFKGNLADQFNVGIGLSF